MVLLQLRVLGNVLHHEFALAAIGRHFPVGGVKLVAHGEHGLYGRGQVAPFMG